MDRDGDAMIGEGASVMVGCASGFGTYWTQKVNCGEKTYGITVILQGVLQATAE